MDFVELQGSGEENVFSATQHEQLVAGARLGIQQLLDIQTAALA
jgi:ribonuclease PH